MGNNTSRATTPTSNPQSPTPVTSSHGPATAQNAHPHPHPHPHAPQTGRGVGPRRRESIQALSQGNVKATAAPPSLYTSLESAAAHSTILRPHSRGRSQTIATQNVSSSGSSTLLPTAVAADIASHLRAAHDSSSNSSNINSKMGNEQSRHKTGHREPTPPKAPALAPSGPEAAAAAAASTSTSTSTPAPLEKPAPSPQTQPVDVPAIPKDDSHGSRTEQASSIDPADASQDQYFIHPSEYSRPPRLPLPIEEEVHTPGSPIISPQDVSVPLGPGDVDGVLPRPQSVLSNSTTVDEEDVDNEETFQSTQSQTTVPTVIEWEGPGERIYVTGTFAGWNRKYRLHRNGPSKRKDILSAIVNINPGTHHLKFIVDGDMRTSDTLPTAVDYTNILVNYLEVSLDDVPHQAPGSHDESKKTDPIPVQERPAPPGVYPPQILPPTPELRAIEQPKTTVGPERKTMPMTPPSPKRYHQSIPRYLLDLDAPEESSRLARANTAATNLPTPPTLPMFLSKSILNGTTPMKDDSSVLIMPNHTVLNHLATSSIKDNILATSATTRYKQKFLTTIMYKPKYEDPDRER